MKRILLSASLLLFLAGAFLPAQGTKWAQKPFTEKELQKAIADWPAVAEWLGARGKKISSEGNLASAVFLDKDFAAFLKGRGWTTERFAYVTGQAYSLMTIVAGERANPDANAQFDEAIAQIRASDMSAADKESSVKAIEDARSSMSSAATDLKVDQGELAIVRKRFDELRLFAESMEAQD